MKTVNWGILGLGLIANEFAQAANNHNGLYACAARNIERAEAFAEKYNVKKAYGSYEDLLNDEAVDAVYIATVNSTHIDLIEQSLKHHKHVLCEKALCTDLETYDALQALAHENGVILAEAMTVYHMPLYRELKKRIAAGEIGKIKFVEAELGSLKEDTEKSHFFKKELGGGAMGDIVTYVLSFVDYFLEGNVDRLQHTMSMYAPTQVDEMWSISLHTDKEEIGSANVTYRCKLPKRAIIGGEKAYYIVNEYPRADHCELVYPDGRKETVSAGETKDALLYEMENFEKAIVTGDAEGLGQNYTRIVISQMDQLLKEENLPTK